jgi:hypothetical protein
LALPGVSHPEAIGVEFLAPGEIGAHQAMGWLRSTVAAGGWNTAEAGSRWSLVRFGYSWGSGGCSEMVT